MPGSRDCVLWLKKLVTSTPAGAFLVDKYGKYRREKCETDRRRVTERELRQLNRKIDKLLTRLDDSNSLQSDEKAGSDDDECVVCLSANATMQTHPCGHRVTCRKCFIRTIQSAISQRALPLRCVVCRSRIVKVTEEETVATPRMTPDPGCPLPHHHHHHHHSGESGGSAPIFAKRFLSVGSSNPDLGPTDLLDCTAMPGGLIDPVLLRQSGRRKTKAVAAPCPGKNKIPTEQRSRNFRDANQSRDSSKVTKWKPFVKQISI